MKCSINVKDYFHSQPNLVLAVRSNGRELSMRFLLSYWPEYISWRFVEASLRLYCFSYSGALLYLEQKKSSDVDLAFFKINAVLGFVILVFVIVGGWSA